MIAWLSGTVKFKNQKSLVLETHGVGFEIFVSAVFLDKIKVSEEKGFFCHLRVREDLLELYGFETAEEKSFFELLLSVSGVGPKSALQVLNLAKVSEIQKAILRGDPSLLRQVSGIGQKTAERIVVELKNKIDSLSFGDEVDNLNFSDKGVFDALTQLGYSLAEIRFALAKVPPTIEDENEIIKQALKQLGKK